MTRTHVDPGVVSLTMNANGLCTGGMVALAVGRDTFHKFVDLSRGPSIMRLLSLVTLNFVFANVQMQSASHRTGTDNKFFLISWKT